MSKSDPKWSRYQPKYVTGDLLTGGGERRTRLVVYRHDSSALKYTIYNLRTGTVSYEPKQHIDENYVKIGYVDLEMVKLLYL